MKKSILIIPVSICIHLIIINGVLAFFTPETYFKIIHIVYYNCVWLLTAYLVDFYPTSRKERFLTNLVTFFQLIFIFALAYLALFAFVEDRPDSMGLQLYLLALIFGLMMLYRIFFYWFRTKYRLEGGNSVNVVVIGRDKNLKKIRSVFDEPDLGYRYMGYFDNVPSESPTYLGEISEAFNYIANNEVDQIFCMVSRLSQDELRNLITFADNNLKKLKIIPDNKEIFYRAMTIELYDTIPVLNMRELPLDSSYSRFIKRAFDIFFSSFVIVGVLSWLTPIIFIFVKLESPGPLYFKQKRHGVNRKSFWCHKFRSMAVNNDSGTVMATKNDLRVTKVGKILRRTSLDELPQFIDVFLGNMSVVGPRPHMQFHTQQYETSVDKYLVRHFVKPGITGLAQVKGYRGEIRSKADIINRTKLDVFYVEKWSMLLDVEIIVQTLINAVRGEEKAY